MLRRSIIPTYKPFIRLYSVEASAKASINKKLFPKLNDITAEDLGNSSKLEKTFGFGTYHLERSSFRNLPIYIEYKANNVVYTEIRKIKGDIIQFRNDLQQILPDVPKNNFKVVMESKKILIKGTHKEKLNEILSTVF
ncbi:hypothetical protein WICMUC_002056 [Wickerhamomyces mucosus]|uniref:Large ribosomal subunit protein mL49 n=1 Tax=Wickerhamomyces mucosus TaxID=1378264 RepID=A0A9P8PRU5_9ASCO|nr:hypothetical protein WICMUC_002056 [Wickerhamomyces mucosus]